MFVARIRVLGFFKKCSQSNPRLTLNQRSHRYFFSPLLVMQFLEVWVRVLNFVEGIGAEGAQADTANQRSYSHGLQTYVPYRC